MIDSEVAALAALALRNAFWREFSALANKYLAASEGLSVTSQESMMGDLTSIYGRSTKAESDDVFINIWTANKFGSTVGHTTMAEALETRDAVELHLLGDKVFQREEHGEWNFIDKKGQ